MTVRLIFPSKRPKSNSGILTFVWHVLTRSHERGTEHVASTEHRLGTLQPRGMEHDLGDLQFLNPLFMQATPLLRTLKPHTAPSVT